jgi:hypothetical protein
VVVIHYNWFVVVCGFGLWVCLSAKAVICGFEGDGGVRVGVCGFEGDGTQ